MCQDASSVGPANRSVIASYALNVDRFSSTPLLAHNDDAGAAGAGGAQRFEVPVTVLPEEGEAVMVEQRRELLRCSATSRA